MPQMEKVQEALSRFDEDKELLDTVPASGTRAAEHAMLRASLATHERFVLKVREALAEVSS